MRWPLWRALLRLLHCWWHKDRVRVSPREGRLLRLQPACLVRINDLLFEVVSRHVQPSSEGPTVIYDCSGSEGDGRLVVRLDREILWLPMPRTPSPSPRSTGESGAIVLHEDEVEVFPAR